MKHPSIRSLLAAAVGIVAAAVAALAAAAWVLHSGPVSLSPFRSYVADALRLNDAPVKVDFADILLVWPQWTRGPVVRLVGVRVVGRDGVVVGTIPDMNARLSLRALLHGRVAPSQITISDMQLQLVREVDGRVSIGTSEHGFPLGGLLAAIDAASGGEEEDSFVADVRRVSIPNASLTFDDRSTTTHWQMSGAGLEVVRRGRDLSATLRAALEVAGHAVALEAAGSLVPAEHRIVVALRFGALQPAWLARQLNGAPLLARAEVPLSGGLGFAIDAATGRLRGPVRFELNGGSGRLVEPDRSAEPLPISSLRAAGTIAAETTEIALERVEVRSGAATFEASGTISAHDASRSARCKGTVGNVDVAAILPSWPPALAPTARGWVVEHMAERTIEAARFAFKLDSKRASIELAGTTGGVPATLEWTHDSARSGKDALDHLHATAERVDLEQVRYPLLPPYVTGPVTIDVTVDGAEGGERRVAIDADLNAAVVDLRALGWTKPEGERGQLAASLRTNGDRPVVVDSFRFEAREAFATGSAVFGHGSLQSARLDQARFGGNDVGARAARERDGVLRIALLGKRVDLRPWLRGVFERGEEPSADGTGAPYRLDFQTDHLTLSDALEITHVEGKLENDGREVTAARASGVFPGGAATTFTLERADGARRLSLSSADAGKMLRALRLYESVSGGSFDLRGEVDASTPAPLVKGRLLVSDFQVVDAPVLTRILSLASFTGIYDMLRAGGIGFARAEVPFTYSGGTIRIANGRAIGSIGITIDGTIDPPHRRVSLAGTLIPAYTLSSVLADIPLLGKFLVGRKNDGLFGVEYRVSGSADAPDVDVNPLSALAPGVLRRMFFDPLVGSSSDAAEPTPQPAAAD